MNSRAKGCRGEREIAGILRDYGYDAHRSQQFSGKGESAADVVGFSPHIHVEVKRQERVSMDDWMAQARRDRKENQKPCVFHRRNNSSWMVTMLLEDWMELFKEWEAGKG